MGDTKRILSIDGGGIRGIIPATLLAHIEQATGKPVAEMFDLIAGTSTGGIIAAGLARPAGARRKPALKAEDLVGLYRDHGPDIFRKSPWKSFTSLGNLIDERYEADALEKVLRKYLGNSKLSDALTNLLVTGYRISPSGKAGNGREPEDTDRTPYFFKSWRAQGKHLAKGEKAAQRDFLMRDVARATSAAPTFFEPAAIKNTAGESWAFLDGGVFANNPAMCAYASARRLFGNAVKIRLLSLGTGELERPILYDEAKDWGLVGWARPVISVMMDGVEDTVHHQLRDLLDDGYVRFQADLRDGVNNEPGPNDDMDDASPDNIRRLEQKAEQVLKDQKAKMRKLVDELKGG